MAVPKIADTQRAENSDTPNKSKPQIIPQYIKGGLCAKSS